MKFIKCDLIKSQLLMLLILFMANQLACNNKFKSRSREGIYSRNNKFEKFLNSNSTANNSNLTSLPKEKSSLSDNVENILNNTFYYTDQEKLSDEIFKPEYLMSKSQIKYILSTFIVKNNEKVSENTLKGFYVLFLKSFRKNDKNNDNSLSLEEFEEAFKFKDKYLLEIYNNFLKDDYLPYPDRNATAKDTNSTNFINNKKEYFIRRLFNLLDSELSDHLTFFNYLQLRLLLFSWKKCSVLKPFVSESEFICAISIINSSSKSNSYELYKKLFRLGILLSNPTYKDGSFTNLNKIDSFNLDKTFREKLFNHFINPLKSIRYLDFIQFAELAISTNLFSTINPKSEEVSQAELELSLSDGILPRRYNIDILKAFSNKNNERNESNSIDLITFVFRDFFLRKFFSLGTKYKIYEKLDEKSKKENDLKKEKNYKAKNDFSSKKIKYEISQDDFTEIVNQMDFPEIISQQLYMLPYKKRTKEDYQKEVTLKHELKFNENDYLLFIERDNVKKTTTTKTKTVTKKSVKKIISKSKSKSLKNSISNGAWYIFSLLDMRSKGVIDFKSFMNFIEIFFLYHQICLNKEIYYTSVSDAQDFVINYNGLPKINILKKDILGHVKQFLRIDAYNLLVLFTFEEYFYINKSRSASRPHLSNVVNEIILKEYLSKIDSEFLPMGIINEFCLVKDANENVKGLEIGYDIICSITKAVEKNLEVKHANDDYEEVKEKKLKLDITGFYNFKPNI
jgi:hypothetical protein